MTLGQIERVAEDGHPGLARSRDCEAQCDATPTVSARCASDKASENHWPALDWASTVFTRAMFLRTLANWSGFAA